MAGDAASIAKDSAAPLLDSQGVDGGVETIKRLESDLTRTRAQIAQVVEEMNVRERRLRSDIKESRTHALTEVQRWRDRLATLLHPESPK